MSLHEKETVSEVTINDVHYSMKPLTMVIISVLGIISMMIISVLAPCAIPFTGLMMTFCIVLLWGAISIWREK